MTSNGQVSSKNSPLEMIRDNSPIVEISMTKQNGRNFIHNNETFDSKGQKLVVFYQGKEEPAPFLVPIIILRKILYNCLIDSDT